jgi:hypothetical protein
MILDEIEKVSEKKVIPSKNKQPFYSIFKK